MAQRFFTRVATETLRFVEAGDIALTYLEIGDPLRHEARQIIFNNDTNQPVAISDGIDFSDPSLPFEIKDKYYLGAYTDLILDLTTNKTSEEGLYYPAGTQFYVIGVDTLPTIGTGVFMSVIYSSGGTNYVTN